MVPVVVRRARAHAVRQAAVAGGGRAAQVLFLGAVDPAYAGSRAAMRPVPDCVLAAAGTARMVVAGSAFSQDSWSVFPPRDAVDPTTQEWFPHGPLHREIMAESRLRFTAPAASRPDVVRKAHMCTEHVAKLARRWIRCPPTEMLACKQRV